MQTITLKYLCLASAFFTSLGCGTIYLYSAYSTQLAERLQMSASQSAMVGLAGTVGASLLGAAAGFIVDNLGATKPIIIGSILICFGYANVYWAYRTATGSVLYVAFAYCLASFGSVVTYNTTVKASALNFPDSRGFATSIPLSAFGLSGFFFSLIAGVFFAGNTEALLLCLTIMTSSMGFSGVAFVRVYPDATPHVRDEEEEALIDDDDDPTNYSTTTSATNSPRGSNSASPLRIPGSGASSPRRSTPGNSFGRSNSFLNGYKAGTTPPRTGTRTPHPAEHRLSVVERERVYLSRANSVMSLPRASASQQQEHEASLQQQHIHWPPHLTIDEIEDFLHLQSGYKLMANTDFWKHFVLLGFLSGVNQMYIYSCGYIIRSLIAAAYPDKSSSYIQGIQSLQVGAISMANFGGRLLSGSVSDFVVKNHGYSRLWLVITAGVIGLIAHTTALFITNPLHLVVVSILVGTSYGLIYGVYPTIISERFGMKSFAENWGWASMATVPMSYIFVYLFGFIYDRNAENHVCTKGLSCYASVFYISIAVIVGTVAYGLYLIKEFKPDSNDDSKSISSEFGGVL